jgi:hypothetical protein
MKRHGLLTYLGLALVALLGSACSVGVQDGMRVGTTNEALHPFGFVHRSEPGSHVFFTALNPSTGNWDVITSTQAAPNGRIDYEPTLDMRDGTPLYYWQMGDTTLPAQYWQAGTGGHVARVRMEWRNAAGEFMGNLFNARTDWMECFYEEIDGKSNEFGYVANNCLSHRSEAHIYTRNYREGPASCPAPGSNLTWTNGHLMLDQVPECAQKIINQHMRERIDNFMIDNHYEINHSDHAAAHVMGTTTGGGFCGTSCEMGGFFGGHERYLRYMKRQLMVYDYPWAPEGAFPSWNSATTIPALWRTAVVSSGGNCNSRNCDGWRSDPITNASPNRPLPTDARPENICALQTPADAAHAVHTWHDGVHVAIGGAFGSFDSPSFPLFYLWHGYVNDVWVNWRACGHPLPGP